MASTSTPPVGRTQTRLQGQAQTAPQNRGSLTITQSQSNTNTPVLRLRGAPNTESESSVDGATGLGRGRRIQWAEDVVDNEGLGRKKSKGIWLPSSCFVFWSIWGL